MADKFKTALDAVRAEDSLKADTICYLQREMQRRSARKHRPIRRIAAALTSMAALFVVVFIALYGYHTPAAFVDVDVNPSIGLALNRFDRVIDAQAYNKDGEEILTDVSLRHKSYEDALTILLNTMNDRGYITNEGLVSVTLQARDADKETALLSDVQDCISDVVYKHCPAMMVDVFAVDAATRDISREHGISPAKYLAIMELMSVDPYASIEGCRSYSIREIQQEAKTCMMRKRRNESSTEDGDSHRNGGSRCRNR